MAKNKHRQDSSKISISSAIKTLLTKPITPKQDNASILKNNLIAIGIVFLISFVIFFLTSAPGIITEGDAAEFTATAHLGGIPHPPGYPSYILLTWIISWFTPVMSLARVLNLLSSFSGALASTFVTAILLNLFQRWEGAKESWLPRLIAITSGLLLAVSREFWTQALGAEVYALMMALLLGALFLNITKFGEKHPYIAPFLLSFGFGVHHTILVLSIPILIEFIYRTRAYKNKKTLLKMALGFTVGCLTFLYLPLRSATNPAMDFVNPETWEGFINLVTMKGMPSLNPESRTFAVWATQFTSFFQQWWRQWPAWAYPIIWSGLIILFITPLSLLRSTMVPQSNKSNLPKNPWSYYWLLFAIWVATTWGFITITNFKINSSFENEVRVFYVPSYAMCSLAFGMALFYILKTLQKIENITRYYKQIFIGLMAMILAGQIYWTATKWSHQDKSQNNIAYQYGKDLLDYPEAPALIFTPGDNAAQPIIYLQQVEKHRLNVAAVHIPLIPFPWYHDMLRRMYPDLFIPSHPSLLHFIQANINTRNIYFARIINPKMLPGFKLVPEGFLLRVVPENGPLPKPQKPIPTLQHLHKYKYISKDLRERSILTEYREGLMRQGVQLLKNGNYELALTVLTNSWNIPAVDFIGDKQIKAYNGIQLANVYIAKKDYNTAYNLVEQVIQENPTFKPAYSTRNRLQAMLQKLK